MKRLNNYNHHEDQHYGQGHGLGPGMHGHFDGHEEYHRGGGNGKGRHHNHEHAGKNRGGAFGPSGYCICVKCGYKTEHLRGVKCTTLKCPECGHVLARKELIDEKKKKK